VRKSKAHFRGCSTKSRNNLPRTEPWAAPRKEPHNRCPLCHPATVGVRSWFNHLSCSFSTPAWRKAWSASFIRTPVVEAFYLALWHPKLINQYGMSDGAEDGNLGILRSTCDRGNSLHRTFLISDMGEPNLPHVVAPAGASSTDKKHVAT
jgi:hypothetical protein